MTSVPEISVVRAPTPVESPPDDAAASPGVGVWAPIELPPAGRPSPTWLIAFALVAGIGSMVLGALAVLAATRSADDGASAVVAPPQADAAPASAAGTEVERRVLALLAKPSTERVVFEGSGGRLVLVVGSAGRAAILVRGLPRRPAARPYVAWVTGQGRTVRAARFDGRGRAAFLSVPVARGETVAVATKRALALAPGPERFVATRR